MIARDVAMASWMVAKDVGMVLRVVVKALLWCCVWLLSIAVVVAMPFTKAYHRYCHTTCCTTSTHSLFIYHYYCHRHPLLHML